MPFHPLIQALSPPSLHALLCCPLFCSCSFCNQQNPFAINKTRNSGHSLAEACLTRPRLVVDHGLQVQSCILPPQPWTAALHVGMQTSAALPSLCLPTRQTYGAASLLWLHTTPVQTCSSSDCVLLPDLHSLYVKPHVCMSLSRCNNPLTGNVLVEPKGVTSSMRNDPHTPYQALACHVTHAPRGVLFSGRG